MNLERYSREDLLMLARRLRIGFRLAGTKPPVTLASPTTVNGASPTTGRMKEYEQPTTGRTTGAP